MLSSKSLESQEKENLKKQNKTRADLIAKKRERERSVMNLLVPVKHISNMLILFVKKEFPKFTTDGYHHTQGLLPN